MARSAALASHPLPGRRAHRKLITRGELIRAGRKLFSEKGLYESRVEDLTATAGIAKGTLYRYFRDKDHLIQAVVADGFAALKRQIGERMATCVTRDERLAGIVAAHVEFFSRNPDLMRVFHQVRGMLKFGQREWQPLRRALRGHLVFLAESIEPPSAATAWSAAVRRDIAVLLFGAVSGVMSVTVASRHAPHPDARALPRAIAAMASAFAGGNGSRSGPALPRSRGQRGRRAGARKRKGGRGWSP